MLLGHSVKLELSLLNCFERPIQEKDNIFIDGSFESFQVFEVLNHATQ
jgi:hypothetical protein